MSSTRTMSWFPESDTSVNITIVITTPGADYTALRSFGSAADFGDNLVNSMDRSYELRNGRKPKKPVQVCTACRGFLFLSFSFQLVLILAKVYLGHRVSRAATILSSMCFFEVTAKSCRLQAACYINLLHKSEAALLLLFE